MPKSVREILDDHIANILAQLDPAREHVVILERELAEARRAKAAIVSPAASALLQPNVNRLLQAHEDRVHVRNRVIHYGGGEAVRDIRPPASPYSRLTMKQLVRKALTEHFINGATANELLDHFHDVYARNDVVRTSLSPQLSRLKRDGDVILRGKRWYLAGENETLALAAPQKTEPSSAVAEDGS
jgi:hypothetical protein